MKKVNAVQELLQVLGRRLRRARLERNDTVAVFAERLGVSERTVRAMEHGLPTVQIGTWLAALWLLDALQQLDPLLQRRDSLLDVARREERTKHRQRASRRRA